MSINKHFFHLTDLSILTISGDDAATFLQGQLTNDINLLDNNWQYSGYCNPKGRLLALFMMWRHEQSFYLILPSALLDPISTRLHKFIMRSKVTVGIEQTRHIYGVLDINQLGKQRNIDTTYFQHNQYQDVVIDGQSALLNLQNRYLYITDQPLPANTDCSAWQALDIEQGIPNITPKTSELFIPQMVNLDALNGISFEKGCYTGQEIIARLHYLGDVKQRLFVLQSDSPLPDDTQIGGPVFSLSDSDKRIGQIIDMSKYNNHVLAVLRVASADQIPALHNGIPLTIK